MNSADLDMILGTMSFPTNEELSKAERQVDDLETALAEKIEKEKEYMMKVNELDRWLQVVIGQTDSPVFLILQTILSEEKKYFLDLASRQHVLQQEEKLEDAKQKLRIMRMKMFLLSTGVRIAS